MLENLLGELLPAQSHQNYEVIVCCDGRNERVEHLVARLKDPRIRLYSTPEGIASAWGHPQTRLGIDVAEGDYFVRINDDNIPNPDYLAALLGGFSDDVGLCYGRVVFKGEARRTYSYLLKGSYLIPGDSIGTLKNGNIDCLCYMVRMDLARHYRDAWGDMYAADWRFVEAMMGEGVRMRFLNRVIAEKY
jgi:GT2 family glycosyltransferase